MTIELHGYVAAKVSIDTVGDLREFAAWLDTHHVDSARPIETNGPIFLVIADAATGDTVSMIECGDHTPPDLAYDAIINTHSHDEPDPKPQPARYDWMSIDRFEAVWDGLPE